MLEKDPSRRFNSFNVYEGFKALMRNQKEFFNDYILKENQKQRGIRKTSTMVGGKYLDINEIKTRKKRNKSLKNALDKNDLHDRNKDKLNNHRIKSEM